MDYVYEFPQQKKNNKVAATKAAKKSQQRRSRASVKQPKKVQVATQKAPSARPRLVLSSCAKHYALAIAKPFSTKAVGACVPAGNTRESAKYHVLRRAIINAVNTGTYAGQVGLWFSPVLCYDRPFAWIYIGTDVDLSTTSLTTLLTATNLGLVTPTAAKTLTSTDLYNAFGKEAPLTTVFNAANAIIKPLYLSSSIMPNSASDLIPSSSGVKPDRRARIVSSGVMISNISQAAMVGGRIIGAIHPSHDTLGSVNYSMLSSAPYVFTEKLSKQSFELAFTGITEEEKQYSLEGYNVGSDYNNDVTWRSASYPFCDEPVKAQWTETISTFVQTFNFTDIAGPCGMINIYPLVSANWAAPQFEFDYVEHIEVIGKGQDNLLSKSHNDPYGAAAVTDAVNRSYSEASGSRWGFSNILNSINSVIREADYSHVVNTASSVMKLTKAMRDVNMGGGNNHPRLTL